MSRSEVTRRFRQRRKEAGLCVSCKEPVFRSHVRCVACLDKQRGVLRKYREQNKERLAEYQREHDKKRAAKLKSEIIEAYGGKCQCPGGCDISEPKFLTIDHTFNDGSKDRRENFGRCGDKFYKYLKKQGFPKDRYRLLCYNCNLGRRHGPCPHEGKHE